MDDFSDLIDNLSDDKKDLLKFFLSEEGFDLDSDESNYVAPRTPLEDQLAEIWAGVLGLERVGIHDNFFEIGGDSIQSIQIIAKANQAGIAINSNQLFSHLTIAELAEVALVAETVADLGPVSGPMPLTPAAHWFFQQQLARPEFWNQAILLTTAVGVRREHLGPALESLQRHHDGLRLRFVRNDEVWSAHIAESDLLAALVCEDVSSLDSAGLGVHVRAYQQKLAEQANLGLGGFSAVFFDAGAVSPGRLLLVCHGLVVDGLSLRILSEDLLTILSAVMHGRNYNLPSRSTSLKYWSEQLQAYAASAAIAAELDYWIDVSSRCKVQLALMGTVDNSEGAALTYESCLSKAQTEAFLHATPAFRQTRINDLLLAALACAFGRWLQPGYLQLALQCTGREDLGKGLNMARTVGSLASVFPVALPLDRGDSLDALQKVMAEATRLPGRGFGYNLLRYLTPDRESQALLQALPSAAVSFEYLGQLSSVVPPRSPLLPAAECLGPSVDPKANRPYVMAVSAKVQDGRLVVLWTYPPQMLAEETVTGLADTFNQALISLAPNATADSLAAPRSH